MSFITLNHAYFDTAVRCPVPDPAPHTSHMSGSRYAGTPTIYSCGSNYVFKIGGYERTMMCMSDGQWHENNNQGCECKILYAFDILKNSSKPWVAMEVR